MQKRTNKKHLPSYFWLLFISCPGSGYQGNEKQGKLVLPNLDDTIVGVCDNEGVGWKGGKIAVLNEKETFENTITVQWKKLVERPQCVDTIKIYMNDDLKIKESNPTDRELTTFTIKRKVCKKEHMKISIHNKKGLGLGLLKKDENFDYRVDFSGVSKPELFFTSKLPQFSPTKEGKITIELMRNMFKYENMEQCLTNIKVKTKNNGTFQGIRRIVKRYVNICEDETIDIEYLYHTHIFSTKTLQIKKTQDCEISSNNQTQINSTEQINYGGSEVSKDSENSSYTNIVYIIVPIVSTAIVLTIILMTICLIRRKKKSVETEVVDDNPYYGHPPEDYNEGDTQFVDNNDYYE